MTLLRNTGQSVLPLGNNPTNKLSEGYINQVQNIGLVKAFTPSYTGFSVDPTGSYNYINLGSVAVIYAPSDRIGTSTGAASTFTIDGLPLEIRPTMVSVAVNGLLTIIDGGTQKFGRFTISVGGTMTLALYDGTTFQGSTFAAGNKGIGEGTTIIYPIR